MDLYEAIYIATMTGKPFRKRRCRHNDGEPGVWYEIREKWPHYVECGTAVKPCNWFSLSESFEEFEIGDREIKLLGRFCNDHEHQ